MKDSTFYLILLILDIILNVMWPILLFTMSTVSTLSAFLIGVVWCSDIYDVFRHIDKYTKARMEELD